MAAFIWTGPVCPRRSRRKILYCVVKGPVGGQPGVVGLVGDDACGGIVVDTPPLFPTGNRFSLQSGPAGPRPSQWNQ